MKKDLFSGIKSYADTRFQRIGAEKQMNANDYETAKNSFQYSCELCCTKGHCGAVQCVQCPIRGAFLTNASIFWNDLSKQEKDWVLKEKELA